MDPVPFAKMNGAGNSILVVDLRGAEAAVSGPLAAMLGHDPHLGFDQLMAISDARSAGSDAYVDIFNRDGSRAGACGNGTRCVAWMLSRRTDRNHLIIETAAGRLDAVRQDATTFSVDMGRPRLDWRDIPLRDPVADTAVVTLPDAPSPALMRFAAVSMGNPHAVFFVPDAMAVDLAAVGPQVETNSLFPDRVNVSIAEIVSRDAIRLRVWERGAGATLACGSAACATLVAAARAGLTERRARVMLPGGDLCIAWTEQGQVVMTGEVALEHEGTLSPSLFAAAA